MQVDGQPLYIDLFAGCGGISLGLYNAGWRGLFAIEKSGMAFKTLRHNLIDKKNHFDWPAWLPITEHNIVDVLKNYRHELEKLQGKVDLVAGGPPCQGFSLAGLRREDDERNKLVDSYIKFVDLVKPKMLFFENVMGFTIGFKSLTGKGNAYSEYMKRELSILGYDVEDKVVNFSEFGVPQRRKRFILVGMLDEFVEQYFESIYRKKKTFLESKGLKEYVSLWEALSDLERKHGEVDSVEYSGFKEGIYGKTESPYQKWARGQRARKLPDSHRFANHRKEITDRMEFILENCPRDRELSEDFKSRFGLKKQCITPLGAWSNCPSLTTLPDDYIHYCEPRILTVREYARIQSFPDWFEFKNSYTTGSFRRKHEVPRYTQVGNAVPPLFAELAGNALGELI
jgi:DNA (cytosine-5)-methyltransferase 1